jgi:hypothetical protein
MGLVKFIKELDYSEFNALESKDIETLYFINDTRQIFLGDEAYGAGKGLGEIHDPTAGDIVAVEANGALFDSRKAFTDAVSSDSTEAQVPTVKAVYDSVQRIAAIWDKAEDPSEFLNGVISTKSGAIEAFQDEYEAKREWRQYIKSFGAIAKGVADPAHKESSIISDGSYVIFDLVFEMTKDCLKDAVLPAFYQFCEIPDTKALRASSTQRFPCAFAILREGTSRPVSPGVVEFSDYRLMSSIPIKFPDLNDDDSVLCYVSGSYWI